MRMFSICVTASLLALVSGCASFEDVSFDEQAKSNLAGLANSQLVLDEQQVQLSLTELLSVSDVEALVEQALTHNPGLQQTLIALKTAQQQFTITASNQWMDVTAGLNANKSEGNTTNYTPSVDISWTADIWQQLSNATDAQQASVSARAFAYQGARDMLAASVMRTYLQLVQTAQLIDIEQRRVQTLQTNEQIIIDRYRKGLTDLKDLDTAKSSTQSSEATLVDYQNQYQQLARSLTLLTGVSGESVNRIAYAIQFPDVKQPLADLSTRNLGRRPDLQQAYQNILASQYQHKVAYKSLLPSLSLSGSVSNSDINLHDALFGSSAWQLLGQISAPLFNAGRLTSEVETARLNAESQFWAFQEILLTAINEVDDAVANETALAQQLSLTQSAFDSAKRSEATYTARYRHGTSSLLDLLQVQQGTFSLEAQLAQLKYQQLSNRINLGLALGLGV